MTDETNTDTVNDSLNADRKAAQAAAPEPEPQPENDAAARMRAFEDQHIGADAHRIDGQVERGVGSLYSRLSPARHRHYEALERLVASEQKLAAAHAALIQADVEHDEAMAAADAAESEPDVPPAP